MHSFSWKLWACKAARLVLSRQFPGRGKRQKLFLNESFESEDYCRVKQKICVKTLKSWTLQFPHASGFLLFMVLRLRFWRIGLRFLSETIPFSLVHIITAAAAFSVWVRLERGVQRGGTLQKPVVQPCTLFSFKFAQEFIIYLPTIGFMLLPWCTS